MRVFQGNFRFFKFLFIVFFVTCVRANAADQPRPYVLDGTEVRDIHSSILQRDYQIFVNLPESYAASNKTYPVLFVTDANYAFPLIRSINRRVSDGGNNLQEFILIGLSYAKGDSPTTSRNRDYTPTDVILKKTNGRDQVNGPYGQGAQYQQFVAKEVFPFVAQNYRADMNRKIYVGHSYGSLLGVQILLSDPRMFNEYILGSPSFWYDKHYMFDLERHDAAKHKDLPAKVLMFVGAYESVRPQAKNPRYNKDVDMEKDMRDFTKQVNSHHYQGLSLQSTVLQDEDHLTIFPALITRGLMWALGSDKIRATAIAGQ